MLSYPFGKYGFNQEKKKNGNAINAIKNQLLVLDINVLFVTIIIYVSNAKKTLIIYMILLK